MLTLPHHRLAGKVREGARDVMYRGRRVADGAPVLIKVPRREIPSARDIARVKLELAITRELEGPGVVRALGLERCGNGLALVLEDPGGQTLREILEGTGGAPIELEAALRVAASIAGALEAIHQRGFVHRDIKPDSIFVDPETWAARLTDLGLAARASGEAGPPTGDERLEGALAYMAPERTGRLARTVDHRADLYALGITLYELLTGAPPFTGDPVEIVHAHLARTLRPLRGKGPGVPEIVSDVVVRLLAKAPDDRYQTARGLRLDLEECARRLSTGGAIEPFALGQHDAAGALRTTGRLHGRADDLAALAAAWGRAREGGVELALVEGGAGVGKSALAGELAGVARGRGHFAAGRFEQRGTPYAAIARALGGLVRQIAAQGEEAAAAWRTPLLEALGRSGQVLVDLIPDVELLVGPQPPAPALPPDGSRNRFLLVVQGFVRVLAAEAHPLVLSLDDLQWADAASIALIERILTDPGGSHLLVLGAHRGGDAVLPGYAGPRTTVSLAPLPLADVGRMVAEALSCDEARAAPLAEIVAARSGGVPLLVRQLLASLHESGLLSIDARSGAFGWDLARVQEAVLPADLVAAAATRMRRLAPASQRALGLAACVGRRFDLRALAALLGGSQAAAAEDLRDAVQGGLVAPLGGDYRLLLSAGVELADDAAALDVGQGSAFAVPFDVVCEFFHDRIQQAALSLLDERAQREAHRDLARRLAPGGAAPAGDWALFEAARHAEMAAPLLVEPAERAEVARLLLDAARRAKAKAAYEAAAGHARAGASLLGEGAWEAEARGMAGLSGGAPEVTERDTAFQLQLEQAECEHMRGDVDGAEALLDDLLARPLSDLEQARAQGLRVVLRTSQGRIAGALSAGRAALSILGVELPATEDAERAAPAELAAVEEGLAGRRIEALLDAPTLTDPRLRAALALLLDLQGAALLTSPALRQVVAQRHVVLSLRHGHSETSAYGYMIHAAILASSARRYSEALAFGRLALALGARSGEPPTCKLSYFFGSFLHLVEPLRLVLPLYARAIHAGLDAGDFLHVSYACCHAFVAGLAVCDDLAEAEAEADRLTRVVERTGEVAAAAFLTAGRQLVRNLAGRTRDRLSLTGGGFDEGAFAAKLEEPGFTVAACWYHAIRLQLLFLYGDHRGALDALGRAEATGASSAGMYFTTEISFYACLTLCALPHSRDGAERARRQATLDDHRGRVEAWARGCADNFRHKLLLIDAELARVEGDELEAMALYDAAIEAAREGGFARDEALADELCARFHLRHRRQKIARAYLTDAYHGYLRWGAIAKADDIVEWHPDLLLGVAAPRRAGDQAPPDSARGAHIDVDTVIRAAQAITGEIVLERLLSRLMRVVVENAGAQRGLLFMDRGGRFVVEAAIRTDPDVVEVGLAIPAEDCDDCALTVVRHVARARSLVVLGEATRDGRFAGDPYIAAARPRSILCMPLAYQGGVLGLLYLENNAARDAFPPPRIELLGVLASLASIALGNAVLYARIEAVTAELRRANEGLEGEVARRTDELSEANARLEEELAGRARAEGERVALQDEIIASQHARLLELSAPLIPITDQIMVMPLIGAMDPARADQVLEAALSGAHAEGAGVVILDITGVRGVTSDVAGSLARTAAALRLLGTRVAITGVRGEVARALVELEVDLGDVETLSTLQRGIAWALRRTL